MNKRVTAVLILVLSVMLVIAGCGNNNAGGSKNESQGAGSAATEPAATEPAATTAPKETAEAVSGASEASYTPYDLSLIHI